MLALDRWYVIADSAEIPRRGAVRLRRFGQELALWRGQDGEVRAVADRCPHRGASLALGEVKGDCLACPFHGFQFDGGGACVHIPNHGEGGVVPRAMRAPAYVVREERGWIWLWTGAVQDSYPQVPWFEYLDGSFRYHTFQDEWPVHVSRAVENQLDMIHLAFVHRGTLAFFAKPTATPKVLIRGDRMKFWDSTFAGDEPPDRFFLEFFAPNIWVNSIGPGFFIQAAFVPVDDGRAITYLRTYQNKVRLPILGELLCWLNSQLNRIILAQDRRVVVSQLPIATELRMDEVLIPGDRPVIEYRRMCEAERERIRGGSSRLYLPMIDQEAGASPPPGGA